MKLTTKGRYAVSAMLDLAKHDQGGPVSLNDISQREDISLSYLEQIFTKLRKADLVKSVRGPGGGYTLGRNAEKISVANVIDSVGEEVDLCCCGDSHDEEHKGETCFTHKLWSGLTLLMREYLQSVSLQELLDPEVELSGRIRIETGKKVSGEN
ncbi:MAG: Rrf2 family transcriptional regulator [Gammaproteobacteria bacterium]|nr:MAG: Rrf2 family transcriptional regulator [Gammaproteobacteria bacterium]